MELAFLFVLAAIVVVGVVAAALTLLPLVFLRKAAGSPPIRTPSASAGQAGRGLLTTAAYFGAIGLGYLLLEMTFLSRLQHWIGDPVTAAAVTIAGFLLLSGFGSLAVQRSARDPVSLIRRVIPGLLVVGVIELVVVDYFSGIVGSLPYAVRCGVSLMALAPLGFLMGFPMPLALARLDQAGPSLIPWAWAINGFASVLAAPLAIAIGMTWGFGIVGGLALALYIVPALLFANLPGAPYLKEIRRQAVLRQDFSTLPPRSSRHREGFG